MSGVWRQGGSGHEVLRRVRDQAGGRQSTVSYAPSFGEEVEQAPGGADGAALIEMDQVEGTAGRRMHDLGDEVVTVGRGQEAISSWTTLRYPGSTPRSCTATAATGYATSAA